MTEMGVRRDKAALSRGQAPPGEIAPAGIGSTDRHRATFRLYPGCPISHGSFPERRSDCQAISFPPAADLVRPSRRVSAPGRSLELRRRRSLHVEPLATPDHCPVDPCQLGSEHATTCPTASHFWTALAER